MADEKFMLIALKLAEKGIGSVEPNPPVGAVLVKKSKIIGKGYHKHFGGPHAEINAIADCKKKGNTPKGSTLYVTLEPCSHFGKTPPCTDAIIKAKIAEVIIAMKDPSKHAAGKGIKILKSAGLKVIDGLCEEQAKILTAPFIKNVAQNKPWIIIKWAQSRDGFLASKKSRWISNKKSRADAQILRRRADAILVGINTVIQDNPLLTARPAPRHKKLKRIVLDPQLRIPLECRLFTTAAKAPVIIFSAKKSIDKNKTKAERIKNTGAEIVTIPLKNKNLDISCIIKHLSKLSVRQLLVEGGPKTIDSFLKQGIADELIVYIAPKTLGPDGLAPAMKSMQKILSKISNGGYEKKYFYRNLRIRYLFI